MKKFLKRSGTISSFNLLGPTIGLSVSESSRLKELLEVLSHREREILTLYYGVGMIKHSLSEVGRLMDISKTRVYGIKKRALKKLRQALGSFRAFIRDSEAG